MKYYNNILVLYSLSTKTKQRTKVKGQLFLYLYIVVGQSMSVIKLLSSKISRHWSKGIPVLDLRLDVVNHVRRLDLKSDRLSLWESWRKLTCHHANDEQVEASTPSEYCNPIRDHLQAACQQSSGVACREGYQGPPCLGCYQWYQKVRLPRWRSSPWGP